MRSASWPLLGHVPGGIDASTDTKYRKGLWVYGGSTADREVISKAFAEIGLQVDVDDEEHPAVNLVVGAQ